MEEYYRRVAHGPPFEPGEEMKFEEIRFCSFKTWPNWVTVRPMELARAGFYSSGEGDKVICFCCEGILSDWRPGDRAMTKHRQFFPDCQFVKDTTPRSSSGNHGSLGSSDEGASANHESENSLDSIADSIISRLRKIEELLPILKQGPSPSEEGSDPSPSSIQPGRGTEVAPETRFHSGTAITNEPPDGVVNSADESSDTEGEQLPANPSTADPGTSRSSRLSPPNGEIDYSQMKLERHRLETFDDQWNDYAFVSPRDLAQNGFFYLGNLDRVQCAFCRGVLRGWNPQDVVAEEHEKYFPSCPLVCNMEVGNVTLEDELREFQQLQAPRSASTQQAHSPVPVVTSPAKHPEYALITARLGTFRNWTKSATPTPQRLAEAGFFFVGFSDSTKCFFCDGGLRNWELSDDPWTEHARWFPECGFLKVSQGESFIRNVHNEDNLHVDEDNMHQGMEEDSHNAELLQRDQFTDETDQWRREEQVQEGASQPRGGEQGYGKKPLSRRQKKNQKLKMAKTNCQHPRKSKTGTTQQSDDGRQCSAVGGNESDKGGNKSQGDKRGAQDEDHDAASQSQNEVEKCENELEDVEVAEKLALHAELEALRQEREQLQEEWLCIICQNKERDMLCLPCGHFVCCSGCAAAISTCVICRTPIQAVVRVYQS